MSNKRLYVGGIPFTTTEGELLKLFVGDGKVVDVVLMLDDHRRSKGQGFVEFEQEDDAVRAKEKYHNSEFMGRRMIVDYAKADPLQTPEGKAKFEDALVRRGPRFEKFNRRIERKQGRKFGPEVKKSASTTSFSTFNHSPHPDQDSSAYKPAYQSPQRPGYSSYKKPKNYKPSKFKSRYQ